LLSEKVDLRRNGCRARIDNAARIAIGDDMRAI